MFPIDTIQIIDCLRGLQQLPAQCIQCCVTSPPYFQLRDYEMTGQIGRESTPVAFIERLRMVFMEVKRVLTIDGTLWLNIGDTYASKFSGSPDEGRGRNLESTKPLATSWGKGECKPKDLIGIPWMLAFALRTDGWYLRQDIIWHKPNAMPESVTDRCTKAHEYIFLMSKSARYYFNHLAIQEPLAEGSVKRLQQDIDNQRGSDRVPGKTNGYMKAVGGDRKARPDIDIHGGNQANGHIPMSANNNGLWGNRLPTGDGRIEGPGGMANKRSVWALPTQSTRTAHFATFPEDLVVTCIRAGTREGETVLDPFSGTGTTAVVAACLGRHYLGFELNPKYVAIAEKRLRERLGLFYNGT